jgi:hypothetical protein
LTGHGDLDGVAAPTLAYVAAAGAVQFADDSGGQAAAGAIA